MIALIFGISEVYQLLGSVWYRLEGSGVKKLGSRKIRQVTYLMGLTKFFVAAFVVSGFFVGLVF